MTHETSHGLRSSPLAVINTTHLDHQSLSQVEDFRAYALPLIEDIRKGDTAKAMIAQYYLANKDFYSKETLAFLEPLVESLSISKGYLSKLRQANQYLNRQTNESLKRFIEQHPPTIQYLMSKLDPMTVHTQHLRGKLFAFQQVEQLIRSEKVSARKHSDTTQQVSKPLTKLEVQEQEINELIASKHHKYLIDKRSARVYKSGQRKAILLAAMQTLAEINYRNPDHDRALIHLKNLVDQALSKPVYSRDPINQPDSVF